MLWIILVAALVGLDQWTKWFFYSNQARFENYQVIKDMFFLTYLENRGAAFGILQNFRWLFIVLTIVAIAAIIWYFMHNHHGLLRTALCFLTAGAIGNFIDRLVRVFVVDFLHFYPFGYDFPIFNVADICVTVGCILLVIYLLFIYKEPKDETENDLHNSPETEVPHGKGDN